MNVCALRTFNAFLTYVNELVKLVHARLNFSLHVVILVVCECQ